ncbi:MAG: EamA family transporter [Chloroflexota bacterium]|nr:EamA family transporter [Chloroflexota bacterium]
MYPLVITLVLCSAFMHAGWNLLARRQRSEAVFFERMLIVTALVGFVPAVLSEMQARSLTPTAWACVVGSGCCCGAYYFFLARAYASSDFTVAYPVARALPVLFVGGGDVLRGRHLTPMGWLGMSLVAFGCLLVPLHSFRDLAIRRYINRTTLWMLLTAMGTVGYTLFDKVASETVQQGPATAARYGYIYFLISGLSYAVFLKMFKAEKPISNYVGWGLAALAACMNFGAYWLVLWAYQLSPYASYIVAFRQFSIVIGTVLAFAIYKEQGLWPSVLQASLCSPLAW